MVLGENSAPILIVLGQSNAHAHATHLPDEEIIHTPLKNVHGLHRRENQAFGLSDVVWSGFTTDGMNLGETQDDTCCLANYFAAMWQKAIDSGKKLPDLYIIQISVGCQGIAQFEYCGQNMWYPERELIMRPGPLGQINISLYPLTVEILSLASMNLMMQGKTPQVIGLHWNQWECEARTKSKALNEAEANYRNLFWGFFTALGSDQTGKNIPLYLYRPLCDVDDKESPEILRAIFEKFTREYDDCRMIDLTKTSFYEADTPHHGIFRKEDNVHYRPEIQRYFAELQWNDLFGNIE